MTDILARIPPVAWVLIGFIIGFLLECYICSKRKEGTIHVTKGVDEKPDTYLFEFNIPPEDIPKMHQVVFKVVIEARKVDES